MASFINDRRAWLVLVLLLALILASTAAWLSGSRLAGADPQTLLFATLAVCSATLVNLGVRWLRWHFLLRTIHIRLRARESLLVFTSLLPMILTPWAAGELLLALPLRHRTATPLRKAGIVWLASRAADAAALILIAVLARWGAVPGALAFVLLSTLALASIERRGRRIAQVFRLYLFLGFSLIAWTCAATGLYLALHILHAPTDWMATLFAFSKGTIAGSLSGSPAGIAITGSTIIRELFGIGIAEPTAIGSVAALRWGTVGFAALLGLLVAALRHRSLRAIVSGARPASQGHFDHIAAEYAEEIPAHVRDRLVETKSAVLLDTLQRLHVPNAARGLDIGCGQGWYLAHLATRGHAMTGCDLTAGQIDQARTYCSAAGVSADLLVAPADSLPFPDNAFDFAYTINVLHHITDRATLDRSLREIVRVLKPGAPLIVFEMNTLNPLFRLYLSYLFPFIRNIDDGTEVWLRPGHWPTVPGATWSNHIDFITFIPDFLPRAVLSSLAKLESLLERSPLRSFSAHFAIALVKQPTAPAAQS
ncbi:MAG: methyltransferase domain-containing protein [Kiritimatiellae bacterium]|nr:methyltransferase domain-containing protein [Kiritimatiellia bacterium]MCO5060835.1 methyltransferase domain-containing protein [Kiritimatiellia bacterium]MCO5068289.1 methyltransferase domain-containing protein [Kiritimatiellia bacterium]